MRIRERRGRGMRRCGRGRVGEDVGLCIYGGGRWCMIRCDEIFPFL